MQGPHIRHSGTARTTSFDVNVPFMQLGVHEWDIHALSTAQEADGRRGPWGAAWSLAHSGILGVGRGAGSGGRGGVWREWGAAVGVGRTVASRCGALRLVTASLWTRLSQRRS